MSVATLSRVPALVGRWFVVYLVLYAAPFPLELISGVDELVAAASGPWYALVEWVGHTVFGVEAVPRRSGSGDTMYHHIAAFCVAMAALAVAALWPRLVGAQAPPGRALDRARGYLALYLGSHMLVYGWDKLIPTQMPDPGPDRLIVPYGDSSPMGLLWTFMGASVGYQMLAGLAEVVSGTLLYWRRTRTLGAILAALVMSNVVALNYCYDVPVKLFSTHLLVIAVFVLAPDLGRLLDVLVRNRPVAPKVIDPYPLTGRGRQRLAGLARLALYLTVSLGTIFVCVRYILTSGRLAAPGPLDGVYQVVAFTRDGVAAVPDERRWLRVGINHIGAGAIQWADGRAERFRLTRSRKPDRSVWRRLGADASFVLYERPGPGDELTLTGRFDGAWIVATLRRLDDPPLLTSRGARWFQEAPLNR